MMELARYIVLVEKGAKRLVSNVDGLGWLIRLGTALADIEEIDLDLVSSAALVDFYYEGMDVEEDTRVINSVNKLIAPSVSDVLVSLQTCLGEHRFIFRTECDVNFRKFTKEISKFHSGRHEGQRFALQKYSDWMAEDEPLGQVVALECLGPVHLRLAMNRYWTQSSPLSVFLVNQDSANRMFEPHNLHCGIEMLNHLLPLAEIAALPETHGTQVLLLAMTARASDALAGTLDRFKRAG